MPTNDFLTNSFPLRATLWFDEFNSVGSSAGIGSVPDASQFYCVDPFSTASNGNSFTSSCMLAAGTYTFRVIGRTFSSAAKVDWYIDDNLVISGQDWYTATLVFNATFNSTITITSGGYHKITLVINGHNASSSGFSLNITVVSLINALTTPTFVDTPFQYQEVPTRATMFHGEANVLTGNALAFLGTASQNYGGTWQQFTDAINDSFTQTFFLRKGVYTLNVLGISNGACGIVTWFWEENPYAIGSMDFYSAGSTNNVLKQLTFTVNASGFHWLKGIVSAKNASSSAYQMILTKYYIKQRSD